MLQCTPNQHNNLKKKAGNKKKRSLIVQASLGKNARPYSKNKKIKQRVGAWLKWYLPSKFDTLNSNTSTGGKKNRLLY
jgi:hypothetical protein